MRWGRAAIRKDVESRALELLEDASGHPPAERDRWLTELSRDDPALHARVAALLTADERASAFIRTEPLPFERGMPAVAPQRIGPYRLGALIGEGGMGEVRRGERADGQFEQSVAIKLIPPSLFSDRAARRFGFERQALARLHHPNIAQLYDAGLLADGTGFIVMELVDGRAIDLFAAEERLSVRAVVLLARQVLNAVAYAHASLLLHCDLKPGNILVTADRTAKLLDFGIGRALGAADQRARFAGGQAKAALPTHAREAAVAKAAVAEAAGRRWPDDLVVDRQLTRSLYNHGVTAVAGVTALPRITARVGDAASGIVEIRNMAVADGFSEGLGVAATISGAGVGFGDATGLIAAGGVRNVTATVDTSTAGVKAGALDLAFTSDGAGTSGLAAIAIGGATATVEADVYAAAQAAVAPSGIDFGVVRVGDLVASRSIAVTNSASGALVDTLVTSLGTAPAGFTTSGAPMALAAGESGEVAVGLSTASAGVFSGDFDFFFRSRNPVLTDLPLPNHSLALTGTVNSHANAAFSRGGAALTCDAGLGGYVFDFATVRQGADVGLTGLALANLVFGPADDLSGDVFDFDLSDAFALIGGDLTVGPLAAGEQSGLFALSFDTDALGLFSGRIGFRGVGTNASDPGGETRLATLFLTGRVAAAAVPAPGPIALFGLSAAGLIAVRRRALARAR